MGTGEHGLWYGTYRGHKCSFGVSVALRVYCAPRYFRYVTLGWLALHWGINIKDDL